jgi:hypothetical protein
MKPLEQVDRSAFRWLRQPGHPVGFQLLAGVDPVGSVRWVKPYGSLAQAEAASGTFSLKRTGFLSPVATLRDGNGVDLARLEIHFNNSRIRTSGGGAYAFRRKGILIPAWQLSDGQERPVLHVETVSEHSQLAGGVVAVDDSAKGSPELLALLLLTWYFIVQAWFEEEVASVASSVVVATG